MKTKLLILLMVAFGLQPFSSFGQSKEETLEWLRAKVALNVVHGPQFVKFNENTITLPHTTVGEKQTIYWNIFYTKITGFSIVRNANEIGIVLTGNFSIHDVTSSDIPKITATNWAQLYLPARADVDAEKIVKALKHLATLNGAKLIKDDLF